MTTARDAYLETQVLTAPPARLRLMLIDGAIRLLQEAGEAFDQHEAARAGELLLRVRDILGELMAPLDPEASPVARQVIPVYLFLSRTLSEAAVRRDREKVADMLRVLQEERLTWQAVCEQSVAATSQTELAPPQLRPAQAAPLAPPPPHAALATASAAGSLRFTCDA